MNTKSRDDTFPADDISHSVSSASPSEGRSSNIKNHTAQLLQNDPKIRKIRKMAILVLFIAAIAVSGGVYTGLARSERREFQNRFADQAEQIGHAFTSELDNKLRALDALSVTITSFAGSQQPEGSSSSSWPYVTVPEFSYRAAGALSVGRALTVAVYPVVSNNNNNDELDQWERYSVQNQKWLSEVVDFQTKFPGAFRPTSADNSIISDDSAAMNMDMAMVDANNNTFAHHSSSIMHNISEEVFHIIDGIPIRRASTSDDKTVLPLWQHAPVHPGLPRTNYDAYTVERNHDALHRVMEGNTAVLGQSYELNESCFGHDFPPMDPVFETETWSAVWEETNQPLENTSHHDGHHNHMSHSDHSAQNDLSGGLDGPAINIFYPVLSDINDDNRTVVAIISMTTKWDSFLLPNLPPNPNGLIVTLRNECDQSFSFEITGDEVTYLGPGEHHEADFANYEEKYVLTHEITGFTNIPMANEYCTYTASVYPSSQMREQFASTTPLIYTVTVVVIFLFTVFVFIFYDYLVQRRQKYLVETASKSTAIISSLFPRIVRDRLLEGGGQNPSGVIGGKTLSSTRNGESSGAPIANFFPNTTILFGDIAGFTAWSSSRQPSEVFTLLETLYAKFDSIAREMRVFKVETIGDCYVAATGLPTPQEDHHQRMVKFAKRALKSMGILTRQLEVTLGPETTKLGFRIGIHSGPVTAGVLRGEKSRFQLFGDTVNMASRMESTGKRNCIQVSHTTASLLVASGKPNWVTKREDKVEAKGKGAVQTFWVKESLSDTERKDNSTGDVTGSVDGETRSTSSGLSTRGSLSTSQNIRNPLIDWQVELLSRLLKQIVVKRKDSPSSTLSDPSNVWKSGNSMPRDEIADEVNLPTVELTSPFNRRAPNLQLPSKALDQLEDFVTAIAMMYRDNRFHNFEHACHVTMSANKFLTRVVDPLQTSSLSVNLFAASDEDKSFASSLSGDPMTQFAIIFSALIHDIDHQGVSNKQLADENSRIAIMYEGKSPAEQNSIDMAFEMLGLPQYRDLVSCICASEEELKRFRQLVVNCVMATDIFDKDLLAIRNKKWNKAFDSSPAESTSDLKVTIVIEHIIQAADVAHTMQHWHVYQKWNERLFVEMRTAYEAGRGPAKDPAEGWYEGELWFFDNYVIPLAKKLEECGVFGVSSDECLNYALENRKEWETRGRELVNSMKERYADMKEGESKKTIGTQ